MNKEQLQSTTAFFYNSIDAQNYADKLNAEPLQFYKYIIKKTEIEGLTFYAVYESKYKNKKQEVKK